MSVGSDSESMASPVISLRIKLSTQLANPTDDSQSATSPVDHVRGLRERYPGETDRPAAPSGVAGRVYGAAVVAAAAGLGERRPDVGMGDECEWSECGE